MSERSEKIAALNDAFRSTLGSDGSGKVLLTQGIQAMDPEDQLAILKLVQKFNTFSEANNPYGERDFGSFSYNEERLNWKIDYYDPSMQWGSEDPADPEKTLRVLTVLLASEY